VRLGATRCPRGWLSFEGHCYGYFGQQLSWRRAEAWCQATRGAHLASLHSPEEHRALAAFLARRDKEESVWIGLHRRGWLWADGSPRHYWAWEGDDGPKGHPCIAMEDSGLPSWDRDTNPVQGHASWGQGQWLCHGLRVSVPRCPCAPPVTCSLPRLSPACHLFATCLSPARPLAPVPVVTGPSPRVSPPCPLSDPCPLPPP
uniref:C-type lectin domain-containing protein n=1 Tax=Junco hyemalis TaxID=40217 RepID=A0A8C5NSY4_JUNHY